MIKPCQLVLISIALLGCGKPATEVSVTAEFSATADGHVQVWRERSVREKEGGYMATHSATVSVSSTAAAYVVDPVRGELVRRVARSGCEDHDKVLVDGEVYSVRARNPRDGATSYGLVRMSDGVELLSEAILTRSPNNLWWLGLSDDGHLMRYELPTGTRTALDVLPPFPVAHEVYAGGNRFIAAQDAKLSDDGTQLAWVSRDGEEFVANILGLVDGSRTTFRSKERVVDIRLGPAPAVLVVHNHVTYEGITPIVLDDYLGIEIADFTGRTLCRYDTHGSYLRRSESGLPWSTDFAWVGDVLVTGHGDSVVLIDPWKREERRLNLESPGP